MKQGKKVTTAKANNALKNLIINTTLESAKPENVTRETLETVKPENVISENVTRETLPENVKLETENVTRETLETVPETATIIQPKLGNVPPPDALRYLISIGLKHGENDINKDEVVKAMEFVKEKVKQGKCICKSNGEPFNRHFEPFTQLSITRDGRKRWAVMFGKGYKANGQDKTQDYWFDVLLQYVRFID